MGTSPVVVPGAFKVVLGLIGVVDDTEVVCPGTVGKATCSMGITVHLVPPGVVGPGAAGVVTGTVEQMRPISVPVGFVTRPSPTAYTATLVAPLTYAPNEGAPRTAVRTVTGGVPCRF